MSRKWMAVLLAVALGLAIAQAVLESLAVLASWPAGFRHGIRLAGFFLDLFLTMDFLARLGLALSEKRAARYLGPERGWLDFLTGAPLLTLVSFPWAAGRLAGPTFLPLLATTGILAAGRAARALRLLRPARLAAGMASGRMAYGRMAARHATLLALLGSAALAIGLAALALTGPRRPGLEREVARRQELTATALRSAAEQPGSPSLRSARLAVLIRADPSLLVLREGQATLYSRHPDAVYERDFEPGDYRHLIAGDLELFFDARATAREAAAQDLLFQLLTLLVAAVLILLYTPHFARTVSEPLELMRHGLAEDGCNLEVRVPEGRQDEEVFRLAREYNERYLPLKDRSRRGQAPALLAPDDARLES